MATKGRDAVRSCYYGAAQLYLLRYSLKFFGVTSSKGIQTKDSTFSPLMSLTAVSTAPLPCPLASLKDSHIQIALLHFSKRIRGCVNARNDHVLRVLAGLL